MTDFSGTTFGGIVLASPSYSNPVTITTGAYVANAADSVAVYGTTGTAWDLHNYGTIFDAGTLGIGVKLASGGQVTNAATASITGGLDGIRIDGGDGTVENSGLLQSGFGTGGAGIRITGGTGTINNSGRISSQYAGILASGGLSIVTNLGTITAAGKYGVRLKAGGSVTNGQSGASTAAIYGGVNAVVIDGGVGTVTNLGTITAKSIDGIILTAGGGITNAASGRVTGGFAAFYVNGGAGNVTNLGTVVGSSYGADLLAGGSVTNGQSGASNATISGYAAGVLVAGTTGQATNFGTIAATGTAGIGVSFGAGGYVDNLATGSITGPRIGVEIAGSAGTVINLGQITANSIDGIVLTAGGGITNAASGRVTGGFAAFYVNGGAGTVTNLGTAVGSSYGADLLAGGSVTNGQSAASTATISGYTAGVLIAGTTGQATNYGTIAATGTAGVGVFFKAGGYLYNRTAARIAAGADGLQILGGAGTVVNLGTVIGSASYGAYLRSGGTVTNGQSGSSSALIAGLNEGVQAGNTTLSVINFGTMSGAFSAVYLTAGGSVTNGAIGSTTASLSGGNNGVSIYHAAGSVTNFATITGVNNDGVALTGGGSVSNGDTGATAALISGSADAVHVSGGSGTITNFGTMLGAGMSGVYLDGSGSVTNGASGSAAALISGRAGVVIIGTAGNVGNFGTIVASTAGYGILLNSGGSVANGASGSIDASIRGAVGVGVRADIGTVTDFGSISGSATGVYLMVGGNVTVEQNALILGNRGVFIGNGATTVVNAGVITGTGGTAVLFAGGNDRLVIAPGAQFHGVVDGGAGSNALELGAGGPGGLKGLGSSFVNFGALGFDKGAQWTVEGAASGFPGFISGFVAGDTIDVDSFVAVSDSYNGSGLVLTDTFSNSVTIGIQGAFVTSDFAIAADGFGGTDITTTVCFCRGTRILTDQGEVPVEALAVGDRVVTLAGAAKAIVWIGLGRDLVTAKNPLARPIVVAAGALADGVPKRDLYLTHGHALYLDGVLIPVEHLVNHKTIRWDAEARAVEYYHIELEDHDVLLAEGAPAESYYDAANRALFHNTRPGSTPAVPQAPCAPVLNGGDVVARMWRRLDARAGASPGTDTTDDPDLHLVIDGARLDPTRIADGVYTFALTAPLAGPLRLCSRNAIPSLAGSSRHDHRRLGVAIRQIVLSGRGVISAFDHDASLFSAGGCHAPEGGFCWTDGTLDLPARLFTHLGGPFRIFVHAALVSMRYPLALSADEAA